MYYEYNMVLKGLANEAIDKIIVEFKKDVNQTKIKTYIIDPTIYYILDRLYPYIFITAIIFVLLLLLVIMILILILKK